MFRRNNDQPKIRGYDQPKDLFIDIDNTGSIVALEHMSAEAAGAVQYFNEIRGRDHTLFTTLNVLRYVQSQNLQVLIIHKDNPYYKGHYDERIGIVKARRVEHQDSIEKMITFLEQRIKQEGLVQVRVPVPAAAVQKVKPAPVEKPKPRVTREDISITVKSDGEIEAVDIENLKLTAPTLYTNLKKRASAAVDAKDLYKSLELLKFIKEYNSNLHSDSKLKVKITHYDNPKYVKSGHGLPGFLTEPGKSQSKSLFGDDEQPSQHADSIDNMMAFLEERIRDIPRP